jgi:F-type H+-transporting ATPase subunit alpha
VPLGVEKQVLMIYAGINGYFDDLPVSALRRFEEELYRFIDSKHPQIFTDIVERKALDDELKGRMNKALEAFKKTFVLDEDKAKAGQKSANGAGGGAKKAAAPVEDDVEDEDEDEDLDDEGEDEDEEDEEEEAPPPKAAAKKGK